MGIGTAWGLKYLRQIANAYGELIYLDVTKGTNNEEQPLFTTSTRAGMNKIVTIFCAILPNNK
eukprot:1237853-Ditylum_brightwellii.AAC.1